MKTEDAVDRIKVVYSESGAEKAIDEALVLLDVVEKKEPIFLKLGCLYNELGKEKIGESYLKKCAQTKPIQPIVGKGDFKILSLISLSKSKAIMYKGSGCVFVEGHNNLLSQLDMDHLRSGFSVECMEDDSFNFQDGTLPDVIFNAISDPEGNDEVLRWADKAVKAIGKPCVNNPLKVLGCQRGYLRERFGDRVSFIIPKSKTLSINEASVEAVDGLMKEIGPNTGVLVRIKGFNQGHHLIRFTGSEKEELAELIGRAVDAGGDLLISQFIDLSFNVDGSDTILYPKYRAFMADGKLFPIHFFCSTNPFVNHQKPLPEEFEEFRKKRFEEYMTNPEGIVGDVNWVEIGRLLRDTGLDYCGIDFAVLDGKVVVFEVNPGMQNTKGLARAHPMAREKWKEITQRMEDLFCRLAGRQK